MQTCYRFWEGACIAWAANNDHMQFFGPFDNLTMGLMGQLHIIVKHHRNFEWNYYS